MRNRGVKCIVVDTSLQDEIAEATRRLGLQFIFPYQRLVVHSILRTVADPESEEARPFEVVVLPTGAGKSLCFQLPTVILPGITVIVFPLLALIADQKRRLDALGIPAGVLTGGMTGEARRAVLEDAKGGRLRVLLTNPETLRGERVARALAGLSISHLVIDEAHCVIEWGETFRPAYLELEGIIAQLKPVRLTAFTATASPELQARIAARLRPDTPWNAVAGNPDRPNIHYAVMRTPSIDHALTWLLRRRGVEGDGDDGDTGRRPAPHTAGHMPTPFAAPARPAIVFCPTRDESERTARLLRLRLRDPAIRFYHAGLERHEKTALEEWFFDSDDGVLCATSAYGMGVDKSNIRTVIHRAAPATVESYLQESGRGGRDGAPARAVLLVEEALRIGWPSGRRRSGVGGTGAEAKPPPLEGYIHAPGCRRRYLLEAMGAEGECTGCDHCDGAADPCAEEARLVERVLRRPFRMDVDRLPLRVAIAGLDRGVHAPPWLRKDLAAVVKRGNA